MLIDSILIALTKALQSYCFLCVLLIVNVTVKMYKYDLFGYDSYKDTA